MYLIYTVLFTLGAVLAAPFYWWRKGRGPKSGFWAERLGDIPFHESRRGAIWVHAVSLGETLAVAGLVDEMARAFPERKIYLSHVTQAGRQAGEKRLPNIAGRFYVPLDWPRAVGKALERIKPSLLLVVETELWPNLLRAARQAGARIVVVNARMSRHSLRGYKTARPFIRRVLSGVDHVCAQTNEDAERFRQIGALPEAVEMTGNLKFDARPPQLGEFARSLQEALAQSRRAPVWVAASTMPGEEPLVLQAWDAVEARHPQALLILAPRHPARFEEVSKELERLQRRFVRRTSLPADAGAMSSHLASSGILLLDTIGELAGVFEVADVVFMGGSLVPTGGHNLLEPAYWSKPIVFGPHMENFRDIARLFLAAAAAVQVRDASELAGAAAMLEDPEVRGRLGSNARRVLEQNSGATARTMKVIRPYLEATSQANKSQPDEAR